VTLKGYVADGGRPGARPGVVLFPEAFGIGEHVIERARRLAALGHVALGFPAHSIPRATPALPALTFAVLERDQPSLSRDCAQPRWLALPAGG
jgi:hypothetical protein